MSANLKSIEELINALPPERQAEVRDFVEFLLSRQRAKTLQPNDAAAAQSNFQQFFGTWDSGDENSADNERIESDLAREYGSAHETQT